jgi:hypothetical protein
MPDWNARLFIPLPVPKALVIACIRAHTAHGEEDLNSVPPTSEESFYKMLESKLVELWSSYLLKIEASRACDPVYVNILRAVSTRSANRLTILPLTGT